MKFEEAVDSMYRAIYDALTEDHAQDSLQETVEDIVADYYDFAFDGEKWDDDEEELLEELLYSDVGAAALMKMAQVWQQRRPPVVRFQAITPRQQEVDNLWKKFL